MKSEKQNGSKKNILYWWKVYYKELFFDCLVTCKSYHQLCGINNCKNLRLPYYFSSRRKTILACELSCRRFLHSDSEQSWRRRWWWLSKLTVPNEDGNTLRYLPLQGILFVLRISWRFEAIHASIDGVVLYLLFRIV